MTAGCIHQRFEGKVILEIRAFSSQRCRGTCLKHLCVKMLMLYGKFQHDTTRLIGEYRYGVCSGGNPILLNKTLEKVKSNQLSLRRVSNISRSCRLNVKRRYLVLKLCSSFPPVFQGRYQATFFF